MSNENFTEQSRRSWVDATITRDSIKTGCLQRIADATETMAQNHDELQSRVKWLERMYKDQRRRAESLERSNAALRGVITRLKNKIKELESGHE